MISVHVEKMTKYTCISLSDGNVCQQCPNTVSVVQCDWSLQYQNGTRIISGNKQRLEILLCHSTIFKVCVQISGGGDCSWLR